MFDQRHWNYRFVVEVRSANNSQTYELIEQSNSEALERAIQLFKDEFKESGYSLSASILSSERV